MVEHMLRHFKGVLLDAPVRTNPGSTGPELSAGRDGFEERMFPCVAYLRSY